MGRASTAPVEPHQFGRAAGEIPVAAEGAHALGLHAIHGALLAVPGALAAGLAMRPDDGADLVAVACGGAVGFALAEVVLLVAAGGA